MTLDPRTMSLAWKIALPLVHALALSSTIIRVIQRWRTKLLWWDDYLVVLPCALDFAGIVLFLLDANIARDTGHLTFIFSWWTFSFVCLSVIWLSRITLSLSFARIYMPRHPFRILAHCFSGVLFILYLASVLVTTLACPGSGSAWWNPDLSKCAKDKIESVYLTRVPDVLFALDFASDLFLVAGPLVMLWRIKFATKTERFLVLSLFSSSVLTMVATLAYFTLYNILRNHEPIGTSAFKPSTNLDFMYMSHLQASVSLLATNLLVVTTLAYRIVRRRFGISSTQPLHIPSESTSTPGQVEVAQDPQMLSRPDSAITRITLTILSDPSFDETSRHTSRSDLSSLWETRSLPVDDKAPRLELRATVSSPPVL